MLQICFSLFFFSILDDIIIFYDDVILEQTNNLSLRYNTSNWRKLSGVTLVPDVFTQSVVIMVYCPCN